MCRAAEQSCACKRVKTFAVSQSHPETIDASARRFTLQRRWGVYSGWESSSLNDTLFRNWRKVVWNNLHTLFEFARFLETVERCCGELAALCDESRRSQKAEKLCLPGAGLSSTLSPSFCTPTVSSKVSWLIQLLFSNQLWVGRSFKTSKSSHVTIAAVTDWLTTNSIRLL